MRIFNPDLRLIFFCVNNRERSRFRIRRVSKNNATTHEAIRRNLAGWMRAREYSVYATARNTAPGAAIKTKRSIEHLPLYIRVTSLTPRNAQRNHSRNI